MERRDLLNSRQRCFFGDYSGEAGRRCATSADEQNGPGSPRAPVTAIALNMPSPPGIVRLTGLGCSIAARWCEPAWVRGCHIVVVQGSPVPSGDHQPLCVAVSPVPAEPARRAGDDGRTRCDRLLREHPSVVPQVRAELRQRTAPPTGPARR